MMKCIAIDDEPIALGIVSSYCERRGGVVLETYSSPRIGMRRIREWHPDIVFLDIEMNGVSGIELARELPSSCCLIFTSAYAHYTLEGFDANAVDFLHKPYFYDRFDRAMRKAEQWLRMNDLLNASESVSRKIVLKSEYRNVALSVDTILYIESVDNYVRIYGTDGRTLLSKITLRSIEERLPYGEFIRIHRSFVVPKNKIAGFSRTEVVLSKGGKRLPVGRKYADSVLAELE